jgi:hypothetical protein
MMAQPQFQYTQPRYKGVGGWLLLFCLGLTIFAPLITLANLASAFNDASKVASRFPGLMTVITIDALMATAIMAFSIYAGVSLWSIRPGAVKTAKTYLVVFFVYTVLEIPLMLMAGLPSEANEQLLKGSAAGLLRAVLYVGVWFSYLTRSRRVKATYFEVGEDLSLAALSLSQSDSDIDAGTMAASMQSAAGRYVSQNTTAEHIDLNADGTFFLEERVRNVSGTYRIAGESLTLVLPDGTRARGTIRDDSFTDPDGKVWVRMRTPNSM